MKDKTELKLKLKARLPHLCCTDLDDSVSCKSTNFMEAQYQTTGVHLSIEITNFLHKIFFLKHTTLFLAQSQCVK